MCALTLGAELRQRTAEPSGGLGRRSISLQLSRPVRDLRGYSRQREKSIMPPLSRFGVPKHYALRVELTSQAKRSSDFLPF